MGEKNPKTWVLNTMSCSQSVSQSCGINEARVFKWFAWSQISFQFSGEFLETTAFHSILSFLVLKRLSLLPSHSTWKVETVKLTIILGRKTAGRFVSGIGKRGCRVERMPLKKKNFACSSGSIGNENGRTDLRQEAEEGLHVVPGDWVADEGHCLPSDHLQEPLGIEPRELAFLRFPPPIQEVPVRSPLQEAVLGVRDRPAARVRVRWPSKVRHPPPLVQITVVVHFIWQNSKEKRGSRKPKGDQGRSNDGEPEDFEGEGYPFECRGLWNRERAVKGQGSRGWRGWGSSRGEGRRRGKEAERPSWRSKACPFWCREVYLGKQRRASCFISEAGGEGLRDHMMRRTWRLKG